MSTKDEILNVYYRNDNVWMTSNDVYKEINKYYEWGFNKRGSEGHRNMINRDISSRYADIFEKDKSSRPNRYRLKAQYLEEYKNINDKIDEIKRIDEVNKNDLEKIKLKGMEREALVKIRVNQSKFRRRLIEHDCKCKICGLNMESILIASHSKEWKSSNEFEKLDLYNGFLFCPNHDSLYDKHMITFDNNGKIIISEMLDNESKMLLGLNKNIKIELSEQHKKYVEYHRTKFYNKENIIKPETKH